MARTMISQGSVAPTKKLTYDQMVESINKSASLGHALQLVVAWKTSGYILDDETEKQLIDLASKKHSGTSQT